MNEVVEDTDIIFIETLCEKKTVSFFVYNEIYLPTIRNRVYCNHANDTYN